MTKKKPEEDAEKQTETKESEKIILDLRKEGLSSEEIGLILKNKHKISIRKEGTKIGKILKKHNLFEDPDIKNIMLKIEKIKKHLGKNRQDHHTKRALSINEARLKKLKKRKG